MKKVWVALLLILIPIIGKIFASLYVYKHRKEINSALTPILKKFHIKPAA